MTALPGVAERLAMRIAELELQVANLMAQLEQSNQRASNLVKMLSDMQPKETAEPAPPEPAPTKKKKG